MINKQIKQKQRHHQPNRSPINLQLIKLVAIWLVLVAIMLAVPRAIMIRPFLEARRVNRCELAGELYILDVSKDELPLWLCIAKYESRFNTHVVGKRNEDGSSDWGIFQISDKFWCLPDNETDYYTFNECNINCTDLIKDDITDALRCAQMIQQQQGWEAWTVYEEFCNDTLDDIDSCFGESLN